MWPWGGIDTASVGVDIGDNVANSLMLDSGASQYLSRTFGTPTNQSVYTLSFWGKRGKLSVLQNIFGVSTNHSLGIPAADTTALTLAGVAQATTTALYRDPAAYGHWVYVQNGTAITLYFNNVIVATGTATSAVFNTAVAHQLGAANTAAFFDGYLSNVIFIDGQALDPSYFGRTSVDTGAWVNKTYTGTYGTNGFKLEFLNGASLGTDTSGNGNNWTLNGGITSANQFTDTPTNNYAVLNQLIPVSLNAALISIGNRKAAFSTGTQQNTFSSTPMPKSGEWYVECQVVSSYGVAIGLTSVPSSVSLTSDPLSYAYYNATGEKYMAGVISAYGTAWFGGLRTDLIGIKYNANTGQLIFYLNGVSQGVAGTLPTMLNYYLAGSHTSGSGTHIENWNFGSTAFTYPANQGTALPLCTANLPTPSIIRPAKYFKAKTRAGDSVSPRTVGGLEFSPAWVWIKTRNNANSHVVFDSVRGPNKDIHPDTFLAEITASVNGYVSAFNSDGYALTTGSSTDVNTNNSANTYVDLAFAKGVVPGIDIVTYTGTGANRTISHALGVAPKLMIIKGRSVAYSWRVYHNDLGNTKRLLLDTNDVAAVDATVWNNTSPTSSVFTVGTDIGVNENLATFVAYLIAETDGFCKVGSYTGNGSADGPFVYCGFRPAFILVKRANTLMDWVMVDTARDTYNVASHRLFPSLPDVEDTADNPYDVLSNGFKSRSANIYTNAAELYVFAAFAEMPFNYSNAR